MTELNIPHREPLKFAKYIVSKDGDFAVVRIEFNSIPTLPMITEAAAQSAAAFGDNNNDMGYLVSLKNIKLLTKLKNTEYDVNIIKEHKLNKLSYFRFEIFQDSELMASGVFIIAVE